MKPGDRVQLRCFDRLWPFRVKEVWPDGRCLVEPIPMATPTGLMVPFANAIVVASADIEPS